MHFYGKVIFWGSICRVDCLIRKDEIVEQVLFRVSAVLGKKVHVIAWIQWKLLEEQEVQVNYLISNGLGSRK